MKEPFTVNFFDFSGDCIVTRIYNVGSARAASGKALQHCKHWCKVASVIEISHRHEVLLRYTKTRTRRNGGKR